MDTRFRPCPSFSESRIQVLSVRSSEWDDPVPELLESSSRGGRTQDLAAVAGAAAQESGEMVSWVT